MDTCCVSPTVAKPFQTPVTDEAEEDWPGTAEVATEADSTPSDNARVPCESIQRDDAIESLLLGWWSGPFQRRQHIMRTMRRVRMMALVIKAGTSEICFSCGM
jgi:hypothetical protein